MYIAEGRGVDKLKTIARLTLLVFFTVLYTVHCHELLSRNSDGERAVQWRQPDPWLRPAQAQPRGPQVSPGRNQILSGISKANKVSQDPIAVVIITSKVSENPN